MPGRAFRRPPGPGRRARLPLALLALVVAAATGCGLLGPDLDVAGVDAQWFPVPGTGGRSALAVVPDGTPGPDADPAQRDAAALLPLVVVAHGLGSDAEETARTSGLAARVPGRRYVAVFVEGEANSFAAGACCGTAAAEGTDDLGYLRATITTAHRLLPVDPARTYLVGYSNGGMLTYRFLCGGADLLAGAASVAGSVSDPSCTPTSVPSFLQVSGALDELVPPGGGTVDITGPVTFPPVDDVLAGFAATAGCPARPSQQEVTPDGVEPGGPGSIRVTTWGPCADGVQLRSDLVAGRGHFLLPDPGADLVLDFFGLPAGG